MKPINFDEANATYGAEGCGDLPAWQGADTCGVYRIISCWKMPFRQRIKILFTGKIWLDVYGRACPAVAIEADCPLRKTKGAQT